jgi:hypothetical protein
LTDWTPNWDDNDDAAPSTSDLKESDLEIHGTEETKLDSASAVDDTAAANQAPNANTSLDGGSTPVLSSPDSANPLEGDAPPLLDTAILDSGASLEYAAGPTIGGTPATTTIDPMAKLNTAFSLHLAKLDRQCIAISKKYAAFHDLLVQTRTDFDVFAIKARVSSAAAVHTAPLAELVSQAELTIKHLAIAAVNTAMTAAIAHGGLMEQRKLNRGTTRLLIISLITKFNLSSRIPLTIYLSCIGTASWRNSSKQNWTSRRIGRQWN